MTLSKAVYFHICLSMVTTCMGAPPGSLRPPCCFPFRLSCCLQSWWRRRLNKLIIKDANVNDGEADYKYNALDLDWKTPRKPRKPWKPKIVRKFIITYI